MIILMTEKPSQSDKISVPWFFSKAMREDDIHIETGAIVCITSEITGIADVAEDVSQATAAALLGVSGADKYMASLAEARDRQTKQKILLLLSGEVAGPNAVEQQKLIDECHDITARIGKTIPMGENTDGTDADDDSDDDEDQKNKF